ncbi:PepSY domain-containing protein [Roseococcus sp.]|uniref:PepSY domain-containing protein n=1 Tax=Roseococcus sp. TaxID=2109646 RepID=UPI003BAB08F9
MIRSFLFTLHWFIGITAGTVLMVVGITGAMMSFEDELLLALNRGVMTVEARAEPVLAPEALVAALAPQRPGRVTFLVLQAEPGRAVRASVVPPVAEGTTQRGTAVWLDPYDGRILGAGRGEATFRFIREIHRWLAWGDIGRSITGISAICLVVLAASGLYLRWPRRPLDWRNWFALRFALRGRTLFWELHSVLGTWVLPLYLLAALTGLTWSYTWYRDAVWTLAGVPIPQRAGAAADGGGGGGRARPQGQALDLGAVWAAFGTAVPGGYSRVILRMPAQPGQPLRVTYLDPAPPNSRATNTITLAPDGRVREHTRYDAMPLGHQLVTARLALHTGEYFGLGGRIAMAVAALLMPLFGVTGWLLYLGRRRQKRAAKALAKQFPVLADATAPPLLIAFASQGGTAHAMAWQTAASLRAAGVPVQVASVATLGTSDLVAAGRVLFVASTFGEGEPPDAARAFARGMAAQDRALEGVEYGMLSLGDRSYARFCGFGRALEAALGRRGATPLFATVEAAREDAPALARWQDALGTLGAAREAALAWTAARPEAWRLAARRHLNPGSAGWPVYHLEFAPEPGTAAQWQAGDIAEFHVPAEAVSAQERAAEAEGGTDLATRSRVSGLAPRDYSIASVQEDGRMHLLIREMRHPDGRTGLASGWLGGGAAIGDRLDFRIRGNPGFHGPEDDRPLILIGNGTGLAGLRAHLRRRARLGHRLNWLVYGERNAAQDFHHRAEVEAWRAEGLLERLDLAFSRDQASRLYVQHRLREALPALRAWVEEGAAILVCGSAEGMAPAVHAVLAEAVGAERLDMLVAEGRYRRDIY